MINKKESLFNQQNIKWIGVLTRNEPTLVETFEKILKQNNDIVGKAILQFRRDLRNKGRGKVLYTELEKAKNDKIKLKESLQELFLEYIDDNKLSIVLEILEEKGKSLKDLYEAHLKQPNKRIFRIVQEL